MHGSESNWNRRKETAVKDDIRGMDPGQENCPPSSSSVATRREFLKSVTVVGAGALLPASGLIAQVTSPSTGPKAGRIDIHNHYMPPSVTQALGTKRVGAMANWTPTKAL